MALKLNLVQTHPAEADVDTLVLGVFEDAGLSAPAKAVDERSGGQLSAWLSAGDISGKLGRSTLLRGVAGSRASRVLCVGLGETGKFDAGRYQKVVGDAVKSLSGSPARHVLLTLSALAVVGRDTAWNLRQAAVIGDHACYRYTATKKPASDAGVDTLSLLGDSAHAAELDRAQAIAEGVRLCRELGNLPPNICTPAYLADTARGIASSHDKVSVEVLEREQMQALGMGSLLGVAAGSGNPPRLIVLKYAGGPNDQRPYALVGKAITFDTGGISLKPGPGMEEMKFDMCGGASVIGTFLAVAKLGLNINLVAVVPAVENMPDAHAYRPSDVLTSMSGKTIEVLNTDAEGRLILCDALTYAQKYEPQALIDVATLTGACVIALGKFPHGLMTKHDDLANELLAAGEQVHDRAWRLPLWDDYQPLLDSGFADMANIGGKWAGAITAGCFLARFTEGQRWAHLDIAGTAWDEGRKGLATGRPVPLLVEWLSSKAS
ncbi:leucyl aminopeptidase [Aquimonas voraii]|uniref:Probable cytosol aminopeptidase n=1 Tax=Aquimonas voraii TaxID=265719 RepID=A0A1G6UD90_9GAMM|nr:leucyl aminopeptidase [Aquimonas voraii]SDD39283.1 aminopeptidase A. Metallo peptidase. MEROPS family M17 [Aquimonas voraii]